MKPVCILAALFLGFGSFTSGQAQWMKSSLACEGPITALATQGDTLVVGKQGKEFYRSFDKGVTWSTLSSDYFKSGYANDSLRISLDHGKSWVAKMNSWSIVCTASEMFALTNQGLWQRSMNDFYLFLHPPVVVDNSAWFPPVRSQAAVPNCTAFSLVYYLKSYIWNREYNRDPKLEKNQFSHTFVWNLIASADEYHGGYTISSFQLMYNQGCATVADFPLNEQSSELQPSLDIREKALAYKSLSLSVSRMCAYGNTVLDSLRIVDQLVLLKGELNKGRCFTISIPLFNQFFSLTTTNNIYSCDKNVTASDRLTNHALCVTGYNDTIKTPQGRGAFKVINSNKDIAQGQFYLDYNLIFFAKFFTFDCSFLEEAFSQQPEISLAFNLREAVTGSNIMMRKYLFVDTVCFDNEGRRSDFQNTEQAGTYPNFWSIKKINGINLPARNDLIYTPWHNHDGNWQLISDLSQYVSAADFKSLEMAIYDPISAVYIDKDGKTVYSYTRTPKMKVDSSYIKFLGTDKLIVGRVRDLPDTTVVTKNFYSQEIGNFVQPIVYYLLIKQCTSTFKRKVITFDIADTVNVSSGVEDQFTSNHESSNGLILSQNYPNPATALTSINFSLAQSGPVTLKVLNLVGQEVAILVSGDRSSGEHQINFDAGSLPEGLYIYILRTPNAVSSKKMVVN